MKFIPTLKNVHLLLKNSHFFQFQTVVNATVAAVGEILFLRYQQEVVHVYGQIWCRSYRFELYKISRPLYKPWGTFSPCQHFQITFVTINIVILINFKGWHRQTVREMLFLIRHHHAGRPCAIVIISQFWYSF